MFNKLILLSSIFIPLNCVTKKDEPERSEFLEPRQYKQEFGFLYNPLTRIIAKPNGARIEICGASQFSEIKKAINMWANVIHRKYDIVNSCERPSIYNYTRTDAETKQIVFSWPFLKERWNSNDLAFVSGDGQKIYNAMEKPIPWTVLLHEVGHMMGLCDQYKSAISNCARTTMPVAKSVMLDAWAFSELQSDDIEGIRNLEADYKRMPTNMKALTKEELDEYAKDPNLQPLHKMRWQLCRKFTQKAQCEYNDCIWDSKNQCLSSLLSSCDKASSEAVCKQIVACKWLEKTCDFAPLI